MRRQTPRSRAALLAATGLTMTAIAGPAHAQAVPVTYGTDPTGAHPRFAKEATYVAAAAPAALAFEDDAPTGEPGARTVEVAPGDTVYGLARRHGVKPTDIIAANGLEAPYALSLGQTIELPGAAPAADGAGDPVAAAAVLSPTPTPAPAGEAPSSLLREIERVEDAAQSANAARAEAPAATSGGKLDAIYQVRQGDTLYSLSRRFEVPVDALAEANGLAAPFSLSLGQSIVVPKVVPTLAEPEAPAATAPTLAANVPVPAPPAADSAFAWPIRGAIVAGYGSLLDGVRNDGINIAAPAGAPVRASADGEVVYKGDELAGYGNLLLVKHQDGWVSAYAHTGTILVNKGERVLKGQVIAKVGDTGSVDAPQLHFELRHDLRPQDPIAALNGTLANASFKR